jgi:hypothetical protein
MIFRLPDLEGLNVPWPAVLWMALSGMGIWSAIKLKRVVERRPGQRNGRREKLLGKMAASEPEYQHSEQLTVPGSVSKLAPSRRRLEPVESAPEPPLLGSQRETRHVGSFSAKMRQQGARTITVKVWDLSAGGFCVEWPHVLRPGDRVFLAVGGTVPLPATVAWAREFVFGCKFEKRLHDAVLHHIVTLAKT